MSEAVRFVAANQTKGDGDSKAFSTAEEMHEFITFQRQLSRPTDHFRPNRLVPEPNPYAPPPRSTHPTPHNYLSKFLRDPIATSLNSFSRVTNLVTSPTFYDEEYLASLPSLHLLRPPGTAERVPKQDNNGCNDHTSDPISFSNDFNAIDTTRVPLPPPSLPAIPCTEPQMRLPPLGPEEFEKISTEMSVEQIMERIFRGVCLLVELLETNFLLIRV